MCFYAKEFKVTFKKSCKCLRTPILTSSRSFKNPLKIGTRSIAVNWSPRITASSWMEKAKVLRTFHCRNKNNCISKLNTKYLVHELLDNMVVPPYRQYCFLRSQFLWKTVAEEVNKAHEPQKVIDIQTHYQGSMFHTLSLSKGVVVCGAEKSMHAQIVNLLPPVQRSS